MIESSTDAVGSRWRVSPLTAGAFTALVLFTLLGIGGPLFGHGVFAGTDELVTSAPYREAAQTTLPIQNDAVDDTWGSGIPSTLLFADALGRGEFAAWNPYVAAGSPLGAVPTNALLHPITVPFYLLPAWLAPAFVKLLEITVAAGGCLLFLRRLGLAKVAALTGGLIFVSSAFMIVWTNWPQTRVAAIVPLLFWAVERLATRRGPADVALVALAVTAMLVGGFPAVTGYALLAAGIWFLVRVIAEYGFRWRAAALLAAGSAGVIGGIALAAGQLVPFAAFLQSSFVDGRAQTPDDHIAAASLITSIAPWALGSVGSGAEPPWYLEENLVESLSYVGAGALILALVAVASPRMSWQVLPRGVWALLIGLVAGGVVVIWGGGASLALLQQLPVLFAENFVGRARSVVGFLVAVLAAVGLDALLRWQRDTGTARGRTARALLGVAVWSGATLAGFVVWRTARAATVDGATADDIDRLTHFDAEVTAGLALVAAALTCVVVLHWVARRGSTSRYRRTIRTAAVLTLTTLIVAQALSVVRPYWPRVDRATYYPQTDTHLFLAESLEHDRFTGTWGAMTMGADAAHRLRALSGHTFINERLGELVRTVPGSEDLYPTYVNFVASQAAASAPVLDRLATRYFVTAPEDPVLGAMRTTGADGSLAVLRPGVPVTIPVPFDGPLRGIGVTPAAEVSEMSRLHVTLRNGAGQVVATNARGIRSSVAGTQITVPLAAENVEPGEALSATIVLRGPGPITVKGTNAGSVGVSVVVNDGSDGLRLVHAGSGVVYERTAALPRIRWASRSIVEPSPSRRLHLLQSGQLNAEEVVLNAGGGPSSGMGAEVQVQVDGMDEVVVSVEARGAGHLVVADALQTGWIATLDERPVPLLAADHALVAVPVPPGSHQIRLSYQGPGGRGVSTATAVLLIGLLGADRRLRPRALSIASGSNDEVG